MRTLITGAGQIGTQLARDLVTDGEEVTVVRRRNLAVTTPGMRTVSGDCLDRELLRDAANDVGAIFHCIHAPYAAAAWRRELPGREAAIMDVAAELDIPVVFPESVYAFGLGARDVGDEHPLAPVSPLGRVRAQLIEARRAHRARTVSVVASDLVGSTAQPKTSAIHATVLGPAAAGRRAWVMGDPDAPHSVTYILDLTRAMIAAIGLARPGGSALVAPSPEARSQRRMAEDAARAAGHAPVGVSRIPRAAFALCAPFSPTTRELFRQRYLWRTPSVLQVGRLTHELGLAPTPWEEILETTLTGHRERANVA